MILGYLTSVYARASDTFIRGEVNELRRLGHAVHTYSIRRSDDSQVVDAEVARERRNTDYLLCGLGSIGKLIGAGLITSLCSPRRMIAAICLAWRTGSKGVKARLRQVAYLFEAARLARLLQRTRVEHLHDHIGENSGTVAMLASLLTGIPFSMTIHGPGTFYAAEQFALGTKIARSAFTVCISEFCRSQCMLFSPVNAWPRLQIIRCGIDAEVFKAAPIPAGTATRLVCVGRLCAEKGQLLLLEAIRRLVAAGVSAELVLVGDGPMRKEIERRIRQFDLEKCVRITGWASGKQVHQEILAARAMVLPSFAEGLPVVMMEALALGRPVISTYVAGIPELVEPGVNGWLVPAGNVEALTKAVEEALSVSVKQLSDMGMAGAQRVRQCHDSRVEARKLAELFRGHADAKAAVLPGPVESRPAGELVGAHK
jgi:colanic acid/amylovoran biosynthesis glycosyltransferase